MIEVRYIEGAAAQVLNEVGRVERGEWIKVPDDTARRLVAQGWEQKRRGKKSSSSKSKSSSTSDDSGGMGDASTIPSPSTESPASAPETKEEE